MVPLWLIIPTVEVRFGIKPALFWQQYEATQTKNTTSPKETRAQQGKQKQNGKSRRETSGRHPIAKNKYITNQAEKGRAANCPAIFGSRSTISGSSEPRCFSDLEIEKPRYLTSANVKGSRSKPQNSSPVWRLRFAKECQRTLSDKEA